MCCVLVLPRGYLCRSSCNHYWIDGGICQEAFDIEIHHGGEGVEGKCA